MLDNRVENIGITDKYDQTIPVRTGLIEREPLLGSYIADLMTGVAYEVVNASGKWLPYISKSEKQSFRRFDTMACVSYSTINSIEMQLNFMMINGLIDVTPLKDWLDPVTGRFNFSDRFLAKVSGTTENGNYYDKVANAVRYYGLVPEAMWPASENFTWDQYYSEIPEHVLAKGKELLKYIDIAPPEFLIKKWNGSALVVPDDLLRRHILQVPLIISTATCAGWSVKDPVAACSADSNHATTMIEVYDDGAYEIEDHYVNFEGVFQKTLQSGYFIYNAIKLVVNPKPLISNDKSMAEAKIVKREGTSEIGIYIPMTAESALYAMGRAMGLNVPMKDNKPNTVDFDNLKIDGSVKID